VQPLLGVIPNNQDPDLLQFPHRDDFWEHIRGQMMRGWDVACHGYRHILDSPSGGILNINSRGEFAGHPEEIQRERLAKGLAILRGHGIQTDIFMAPAHSYDEVTLSAMRKVGLTRITDGYSLYPYEQQGILHVPQLFAQPRSMPFGVYTFSLHPNHLTCDQLARIKHFLEHNKQKVVGFGSVEANRSRPVGSTLLRLGRQLLSCLRTYTGYAAY
jgi:predicted deacetylase